MNKGVLLFFASVFTTLLFGQPNFKRNSIYLEGGGNGLFASVNYERQLTKEPGIGVRLGVGMYSEKAFFLTIPVGINYLFPLKRTGSFIDAGLGATWSKVDAKIFDHSLRTEEYNFVSFIPGIGYRHHLKQDVMWRISLTPIANKYGLWPWIGFSIGKRF